MISINAPSEIQDKLREALKFARMRKKHSRDKAAQMTGVPAPTIRRFEDTGEISLRQFLMLLDVYGELDVMAGLFAEPQAQTMADLLKKTQRASK